MAPNQCSREVRCCLRNCHHFVYFWVTFTNAGTGSAVLFFMLTSVYRESQDKSTWSKSLGFLWGHLSVPCYFSCQQLRRYKLMQHICCSLTQERLCGDLERVGLTARTLHANSDPPAYLSKLLNFFRPECLRLKVGWRNLIRRFWNLSEIKQNNIRLGIWHIRNKTSIIISYY